MPSFAAWQASHRLVDDGIAEGRQSPELALVYADAEVAVQRRFVPLLNGLQARMASGAPDAAAVIQIARYAADLRELAGIQATLVTPAIAAQRAFTVQELDAARRSQGEIDRLHDQIDAAIDYVGNPPKLQLAWHQAKEGYFTLGRELIDQVLTSGAQSGGFVLPLPEFVSRFTPALPTLIGLRDAAASEAISVATLSRDRSFDRVVLSICVLVMVMAAVTALMFFFTGRVVRPLITLTAKVGHLSDGDRAVTFEAAKRRDEIGDLARAMELFRDALIANENLQEQLIHSQKMQAVGTMAGGVAHELNNLLQPIRILTELLADRLPEDDADSHQDIAVILDHVDRAREIVSNIVTFSRQSKKTVAVLDAAAELRGSGPLLRSLLPSSVELDMRIMAGSCKVSVDRNELIQVLTNLVLNAAQAMRNRGTVRLVLERAQISASRSTTLQLPAGDYASLSVIDSGCGIDEAIRGRIFEPFFTTKPAGQGTGLGLSVAFGIVRGWMGAIQVDSAVDRGTTFCILIPISTA